MLKTDFLVGDRIAETLHDDIKVVACQVTMKAQNLTDNDKLHQIGWVRRKTGMDGQRRAALREGGVLGGLGVLLATGVLRPDTARAEWNKAAFDSKSVGETLSALGLGGAAASSAIALEAPEIAENGAVVPVKVSTELPRVDRIAVLVEKNPTMLSAVFT